MIPTEAILPSFYSDYWYSYDADWWIRIFDDLFEAIWLFFARTDIYCRYCHHWMGNTPAGFHSYGWFIYYQVNHIRVSHQNNIYYFKLLSLNINSTLLLRFIDSLIRSFIPSPGYWKAGLHPQLFWFLLERCSGNWTHYKYFFWPCWNAQCLFWIPILDIPSSAWLM